jgi:CheY-like chemotaxis protein
MGWYWLKWLFRCENADLCSTPVLRLIRRKSKYAHQLAIKSRSAHLNAAKTVSICQQAVTVLTNGQETALLISPDEEDHEILKRLFQHNSWTLHHASSVNAASALLNEQATSVVITERDLRVGDWKGVLEVIHHLQKAPLLIVISRIADSYLWAEALNRGAYDVLAKPLDPTEAARVLISAWIR